MREIIKTKPSLLTERMRHKEKRALEFSKRLLCKVVKLIWIVTLLGFLLAFYCVWKGYVSSLPWVATLVSSAWAALGTACGFYLNMAKSDHREGGITYEMAKSSTESQSDEYIL